MNDYSDIIYLMVAMVVFSLLSINASHMFNQSNEILVDADIEYEGVALAQSLIEEARSIPFNNLGALASRYNNKTHTITIGKNDEYQIDYNLEFTVSTINAGISSNVNSRLIKVRVTSEYLPENSFIELQYLKNQVN